MGIIDTISAGFGMVNRRFWFIAVPVLLDLLLWLGPKFSISPWLTTVLEQYHQSLNRGGVELPPEQLEGLRTQGSHLTEVLGNVNLLGMLAWQVPSIIGADLSDVATLTGSISLHTLESGPAIAALFLALAVLGLGATCLYLGPIAQFVRSSTANPWRFLRRFGVNWGYLLSFFALIAFILVVAVVPLLLVATLAAALNSLLGGLFSGLLFAAALWGWIYLFFTVNAILVSEVNAITAIGHSIAIVKRNFWASLRFIGLVLLIQWGLPVAWKLVLKHSMGVPVAIVGNAYVETGLAAATMIFYRDRLAQWQKANQPL